MRRKQRIVKLFAIIFVCMACMIGVNKWKQKNSLDETELKNGYITSASGAAVEFLFQGEKKTYAMHQSVEEPLTGMADLVLQNEKVVKIRRKPDVIAGKLLSRGSDTVNIQNYGTLRVSESPSLYYMDEEGLTQGNWQELTVGQEPLKWIVADENVCGVILSSNRVKQIRVLLKMGKEEYARDRVVVTSGATFYSMSNGQTSAYKKGTKVALTPSQVKHTVSFYADGKAELKVDDYPFGYAGTIEISNRDGKLYLVNELPIQDYLCGVVPGEMSPDSPAEALKAQAICARSYLLQQMENDKLAEYGAHVDDTVSYQVYGTQPKAEQSNQAVYDTKNEILVCNGKPVSAYFYSTGSGSTASAKEVWNTSKEVSYLNHYIQNDKKEEKDLSTEKAMQEFLQQDSKTIDKGTPWYRWKTTISKKELLNGMNDRLAKRYAAQPTNIQVRGSDGTYRKQLPKKIEKINRLEVVTRGASGVATCLEIESNQEVIRVYSQYSIRMVLGDAKWQYMRNDGSSASGLELLPSGFFVLKDSGDNYEIQGGGYGHGVGMSQNGACALAKQGKKASEILAYYFSGASVTKEDSFE